MMKESFKSQKFSSSHVSFYELHVSAISHAFDIMMVFDICLQVCGSMRHNCSAC